MKKYIYGIMLLVSIILAACSESRNISRSYNDQSEYSNTSSDNSDIYDQFYDDLSPYGQWTNNREFGRVWSPRQSNFRPYYSDGHWAYTDYGWTWVSDYNWGWATFHYGRWYYDNFDGWMWVPGSEWAPAWVSWRRNSDYYGWAPLCPRRRNGSYYDIQNDQWAFVPNQYIYRDDLNNYYTNRQNNITIINNTTVINNTRIINNNTQYQQGPSVAEVEQVTKTKIRTFPVKQSSVPGDTKLQDGVFHIYKPTLKDNNSTIIRGKQRALGNGLPADQTQDVRTTVPVNSRRNKIIDRNRINTPSNENGDVNDLRVTNNLPSRDKIQQTQDINNADLNTVRKRRIRDYQQQRNNNVEQAPANVTPEFNRRRQLNQSNNIENEMPAPKVLDNSDQNSRRILREEKIKEFQQRNQQPNPVVNERSSTSERRPQPTPQSSPTNSNRENIGIKKIRSF